MLRPIVANLSFIATGRPADRNETGMTRRDYLSSALLFTPGEVLALLSPLQEMEPGLYLLYNYADEWAILRWVIDDEEAEQIFVTDREAVVPSTLLQLFMPVGIRIRTDELKTKVH
jgi:hypothetical protein